jgi:Chromo (CHRromatin Organisation MOdifier) domain
MTFCPYQKGQKVWIKGTNIKTAHPTTKLHAKCFGPFKITEVISPVTYRVQLPVQWKIHNTFHATLLHPYKMTELYGRALTKPPPDLIAGQEEWEVENVLASRHLGHWKKLQYLIRWKGFSEAHDSWEPPENLENAHEAIRDFYHTNPQAIRHIAFKEQAMNTPSSSYSPLPNLDELITSFNKLYISMPSQDSSTENLVDQILDQLWRSLANLATGELMPYNTASSTDDPSSPTPSQGSPLPPHVQILEREILALSPPPPSQPVTPVVHQGSPPPSDSQPDNITPPLPKDDDTPLGEGWFHSQPSMHTTRLTVPLYHRALDDELTDAKYLKFTINYNSEPTIEATMGRGEPHYALPIMALPIEGRHTPPANDEEDLAFLAETHMMNSALNQALEGLGDYGVYADVIRLRNGRQKANELDRQNSHVKALKVFTRQQQLHYEHQ